MSKPQTNTSTDIYLSKGGKTSGPFTESEIVAMKKSGELHDYTYIWDLATQDWKPIAPPPAAPPIKTENVVRLEPKAEPKIGTELKVPPIDAVCFDHHHAVTGALARVTDLGCQFVTQAGDDPGFASRGMIFLNLFNPKNEKSMSVQAKVTGITRLDGKWNLQLCWQEFPEILR